MTDRLFVYGTLAPGEPNEHVLAPLDGTWQAATLSGRRFEIDWGDAIGFPGLALDDSGGRVEGLLFSSTRLVDYWAALDAFEGDAYERVLATVALADGQCLEAWVYEVRLPAS